MENKEKITIEINAVKEARLMAKFDQSSQLPDMFKKNNFSILPISRGEYVIGNFQTYENGFCVYRSKEYCRRRIINQTHKLLHHLLPINL